MTLLFYYFQSQGLLHNVPYPSTHTITQTGKLSAVDADDDNKVLETFTVYLGKAEVGKNVNGTAGNSSPDDSQHSHTSPERPATYIIDFPGTNHYLTSSSKTYSTLPGCGSHLAHTHLPF